MPNTVALIMAGGSGTRFWPLSQKTLPKQYLNLLGDRSLIQQTVDRMLPLVPREGIYICSASSQFPLLKQQLPDIDNLILEPEARNTAPCLLLSTLTLLRRGVSPDTVMVVLPADHFIADPAAFRSALEEAIAFARSKPRLVTMGIVPDSPHTGYGYIEAGLPSSENKKVLQVRQFVEKPNRAKAETFLASKNFFWNSGIFIWRLDALRDAFLAHLPAEWKAMEQTRDEDSLAAVYRELKSAPIDTAVLEKAETLFVLPTSFPWSDVGSWDALHALRGETAGDNVFISGDVKSVETSGCLVKVSPSLKVALVGVENLIVVESEGTLLIAHRSQDQLVRQAAAAFDVPPSPKRR